MMPFDSYLLYLLEHLSTMIPFDSSSSVEKLCNKVSLTGNSFNYLSSVEQTCEVRLFFVAFISVLTG